MRFLNLRSSCCAAALALALFLNALPARADLSAGFATFTDSSLSYPFGLAVDASHQIYIANTGTSTIDIFNSAYSHVGAFGTSALTGPSDIVLAPNGSFYVVDIAKVQQFDVAGNPGISFGTLDSAKSIAADGNSNIYVADTNNNRVLKFNASGQLLATVTAAGGANLYHPWGVTSDTAGNIVVADSGNHRLAFFDSAGNYQRSFTTVIADWQDFIPKDLVLSPDGTIFLALGDNGFVHFASDGVVLDKIGGFTLASGVCLDGNTLYGTARGLGGSNTLVAAFTVQAPEPASLAILALAAVVPIVRRRTSPA